MEATPKYSSGRRVIQFLETHVVMEERVLQPKPGRHHGQNRLEDDTGLSSFAETVSSQGPWSRKICWLQRLSTFATGLTTTCATVACSGRYYSGLR